MKGYIIRGQSIGPMHWLVFTSYPTEAQMREALGFELERHGLVFGKEPVLDETGQPKIADDGARIMRLTASARKRWVKVQEVEIVGLSSPDQPVPAGAVDTLEGQLDDAQLAKILKEARKAPPGTVEAQPTAFEMSGTGTVTNPS